MPSKGVTAAKSTKITNSSRGWCPNFRLVWTLLAFFKVRSLASHCYDLKFTRCFDVVGWWLEVERWGETWNVTRIVWKIQALGAFDVKKSCFLAFSCSAVTVVKAFEERGGTEMCWYCEAWRVMWMSVSSYLMSFADFCLFWHVCFCNLSCPQIICFCKPQLYPTAMLIHVTLQRLHSVSNVSMLFPFDLSWTYQNSEEKRF